ncbi:MAG: hypothetical protein PHH82_04910 [Candidatus ainarchaeum sp.]|nr:hypothetical protein [Candidatus ainarchaeum sp.]
MTWRTNISLPDEAQEFVAKNAIKLSQLTLLALQEKGFKPQNSKK